MVNLTGQLRILEVLIVLGRHNDQSWAKLSSFPIHHARFHSGFLGQV